MQLPYRFCRLSLPCLVFAIMAFPAHASGKAHTHGQLQMDVATDGQQLTVQIEAPLDSLLGFEHAPRNAKERKAADDVLQHMRNGASLWHPTAAAQCTLTRQEVEAEALATTPPASTGGAKHKGDEHADLDATYEFRCLKPAQLSQIEHGLFEAFSRLKRIEVRIAGAKGQSKQTLRRPVKVVKLLP